MTPDELYAAAEEAALQFAAAVKASKDAKKRVEDLEQEVARLPGTIDALVEELRKLHAKAPNRDTLSRRQRAFDQRLRKIKASILPDAQQQLPLRVQEAAAAFERLLALFEKPEAKPELPWTMLAVFGALLLLFALLFGQAVGSSAGTGLDGLGQALTQWLSRGFSMQVIVLPTALGVTAWMVLRRKDPSDDGSEKEWHIWAAVGLTLTLGALRLFWDWRIVLSLSLLPALLTWEILPKWKPAQRVAMAIIVGILGLFLRALLLGL